LSEVTKESLHHVEPRRAGGSEVQMKARVSLKPALDLGVLVSGIVIADQVKLSIRRNGLVDQAEKPEPFLVAMPLLAQAKTSPLAAFHAANRVAVPLRLESCVIGAPRPRFSGKA